MRWIVLLVCLISTPALAADELDALLAPTGELREQNTDNEKKLSELARSQGQIADNADNAQTILTARLAQTRAYNALTQNAIAHQQPSAASLRLIQMRRSAQAIRALDLPHAKLLGDYWLLIADLIESNRNARDLREQQLAAMAQLGRFGAIYHEDQAAQQSPILIETKLMLLRLYSQAGENARAKQLLDDLLQTIDPNDPRAADFAHIAADAALVGQPLAPSLRQPGDSDHFTLLVISEDPGAPLPPPSEESQPWVARRHIIDAAHPRESLPQNLGRVLPVYLWLSPRGKIAAVGHSPTVFDRLANLNEPTANETPDDQPKE